MIIRWHNLINSVTLSHDMENLYNHKLALATKDLAAQIP